MRRKRGRWMNKAVDPVLELLDEQDIPMPPKLIFVVLKERKGDHPSRATIFRAIDDLQDYGLIEKHPDGTFYSITDRGRGYLSGEVDASDLSPEEDDNPYDRKFDDPDIPF